MKIEIPFNDWSKERLRLLVKTATSRNKKYGNVGDTFEVDGCEYELTLVIKLPLWFVAECLWSYEGAFHYAEFVDVWNSMHPKKNYEDNENLMVWYHHFRKVK